MSSPSPYSPTEKSPLSPTFDMAKTTAAAATDEEDQGEYLDNVDLDADADEQEQEKDGLPSPITNQWRGSMPTSPSSRLSNHSLASASARLSTQSPMAAIPSSSSRSCAAVTTPSISSSFAPSGPTPLVLGVAVVDFNHLIGPTVEFAYPPSLQAAISDDESLGRLLPFLALPDGAHLSEEDYSYFHCTYSPTASHMPTDVPSNQTLFGISCNRQLASSELVRRPSDVTRSTVQKAVIVIASQPVFGPIRDRLGVVTRAYFAQRDFTQTDILEDFYTSLESSLEGKSGEGAIYMGTSLRELVHKFRHRTLVLLKLLMLQKRVMLYGYPVEKLCTYQYSLVSLIPGLLMNLKESGHPDLDAKKTRVRPTSLRTSDRSSLLRYMGLPLHVFGKDSFFQPYLPLQQIEMLQAKSWLVGTTNQIVTQQKDCKYDLLVNIDLNTFEFADSKLERMVSLTPSDRRWMDDVVRTVEETWTTPEGERSSFKGSDDDLRARFEEYICAALSSVKYADFISKGRAQDISIVGAAGDTNIIHPFSEHWVQSFKTTSAYQIWNSCTDPMIFDICEPRHPCEGKVNAVSDLGLRLAEGLHDLQLDKQIAPTREALSSALAAGSSSIFKAFDGVRSEVSSRLKEREEARDRATPVTGGDGTPSGSGSSGAASFLSSAFAARPRFASRGSSDQLSGQGKSIRSSSSSLASSLNGNTTGKDDYPPPAQSVPAAAGTGIGVQDIKTTLGGIGTFFGSRVASLKAAATAPTPTSGSTTTSTPTATATTTNGTDDSSASAGASGGSKGGLRPMSLSPSYSAAGLSTASTTGTGGLRGFSFTRSKD